MPATPRPSAPAPRLETATEWLIALLLSANLLWTALCLGGVRAETLTISWLAAGITLALVLTRRILSGGSAHPALYSLLPFLLYAALNALFVTPVPWLGGRDVTHWFQLFAIFGIALLGVRQRGPRRLVLATIALLGATAVVLSAYQLNGHETWLMLDRVQAPQYVGRASGFFGNPNSLAAFLLLLIPPALALAFRRAGSVAQRLAAAAIALAFIIGLVVTLSRGGILAFTVALIVWPLFIREWSFPRRALAAAGVMTLAALAAFAIWTTMPSARERAQTLLRDHGEKSRVILWKASLKMTADAPVLGTGAGSFNTVFEKYRPEGFLDEPQWTHNDFLNILSDYGITGFALLFGGITLIAIRALRARPAPLSPFERALAIGLLAFALACLVDFHMHIPALGMTVAILAAEIIKRREAIAPRATTPRATLRIMRITAACVFVLLTGLFLENVVSICRAEAARAAGREKIDALALRTPETPEPGPALSCADILLHQSLLLDSGNAQAWSDLAYMLALRARAEKANAPQFGRHAETAARRALALAPAVPEFWIRLGVALDLQKRTAEAGEAFARALALAPASPLAWYHQAYHLSLTPATRQLALGAAETCLRLDPGYADADTLRVHLQSRH